MQVEYKEKCVICKKTKVVEGYMMWEQGLGYICLGHSYKTIEKYKDKFRRKLLLPIQ